MSQIFKENIPLLSKTSGTTLTLSATYEGKPGRVTVGGRQYPVTAALVLNTAATGVNGLDTGVLVLNTLYYIYAVRNPSTAGLAIVASTTSPTAPTPGPTGFTGWKEIGRFRTLFGSAAIGVVINRLEGNNLKSSSTTQWVVYTPTFSAGFGVPSAHSFWWRQVDESMEIAGNFTTGTAGNSPAAAVATITFPNGLSNNSSKRGGNVELIGKWFRNVASVSTRKTGVLYFGSSSTIFNFASDDYTTAATPFSTLNGSTAFSAGEAGSLYLSAPIAEFAGLWS